MRLQVTFGAQIELWNRVFLLSKSPSDRSPKPEWRRFSRVRKKSVYDEGGWWSWEVYETFFIGKEASASNVTKVDSRIHFRLHRHANKFSMSKFSTFNFIEMRKMSDKIIARRWPHLSSISICVRDETRITQIFLWCFDTWQEKSQQCARASHTAIFCSSSLNKRFDSAARHDETGNVCHPESLMTTVNREEMSFIEQNRPQSSSSINGIQKKTKLKYFLGHFFLSLFTTKTLQRAAVKVFFFSLSHRRVWLRSVCAHHHQEPSSFLSQ